MKGKILGASVYPIIIVSILIFSLVYMSLNVIPHLRDILPPAALNNVVTLFMLGLARFFRTLVGDCFIVASIGGFCDFVFKIFDERKIRCFYF